MFIQWFIRATLVFKSNLLFGLALSVTSLILSPVWADNIASPAQKDIASGGSANSSSNTTPNTNTDATNSVSPKSNVRRDQPINTHINANKPETPDITYRDPFGKIITKEERNKLVAESEAKSQQNNTNASPTTNIGIKSNISTINNSSIKEANSLVGALSNRENKVSDGPFSGLDESAKARLKVAVLYFSIPEDTNKTDVDELTGASIIVDKDNIRRGLIEYLARNIAHDTHADLYNLNSNPKYPTNHDDLVTISATELANKARPDLQTYPKLDVSQYDVVFVGFPVWWNDLPMSLYSFFEKEDLSGKYIIPFSVQGDDSAKPLFDKIKELEPNAKVLSDIGFAIEKQNVPKVGDENLNSWIKKLNIIAEAKSQEDNSNSTSKANDSKEKASSNQSNLSKMNDVDKTSAKLPEQSKDDTDALKDKDSSKVDEKFSTSHTDDADNSNKASNIKTTETNLVKAPVVSNIANSSNNESNVQNSTVNDINSAQTNDNDAKKQESSPSIIIK